MMLGLPNETLQDIKSTAEKLCELGPDHISAYMLELEPGTPFDKTYK